jgi:hypothetical protein
MSIEKRRKNISLQGRQPKPQINYSSTGKLALSHTTQNYQQNPIHALIYNELTTKQRAVDERIVCIVQMLTVFYLIQCVWEKEFILNAKLRAVKTQTGQTKIKNLNRPDL